MPPDLPSPPRRPRRQPRGLVLAVHLGTGALVVGGCSSPVPVEVAPFAGDPLCAEVVLALPTTLGDMPRLETTSQATVAWGDRTAPVVLRCGVEPPPPTTDQCVEADDGSAAVDWVAVPDEPTAGAERADRTREGAPDDGADDGADDGGTAWTFTTYGRSPAVEVRVPAAVADERSTSFLLDLGPAIARVEQTRRCL